MKILKYTDFLNEEFNDQPESYIETLLNQIKRKIDKMFDFQESGEGEEDRPDEEKSLKNAKKEGSGKESGMTFRDLGVRLESSEISKYSKQYDNLTVKFSDDNSTYNLFIMIELKEAMPKDPNADFSIDDIEKCYIKFKKYDIDSFEVLGQITKNIKIKDIDENFLIDLKIELDEKFGADDDEKLEIETE